MEKDKKKIIAGAGIIGGTGLIYLLTRGRRPPAPPPLPPGEDVGMLQGYVLDGSTNERLPTGVALITIDNVQSIYNDLDSRGGYRTSYLPFGAHHFSVKADNYQTGEFDLEISQAFANYDFVLEPLPEAPTEWTEGVEVREIEVSPSPVYVGEIATIKVSIVYPYPLPLPADIYGSILVDGQKLTGQWTINFRNPALYFQYTPTQPGNYTVRAQDKSASFIAAQNVQATYYNPFGGTRIPLCTEAVIPDINYVVVVGGLGILEVQNPPDLIKQQLYLAEPTAWNPTGASVTTWANYVKHGGVLFARVSVLFVVPIEYTCQEYWDSKEELAKTIAGSGGYAAVYTVPRELILNHGITCPKCGGTGKITYTMWGITFTRTCPKCNGLGKVLNFDIYRGWKDWVKFPNYHSLCGGGYCSLYLDCPICGKELFGGRIIQGSYRDRLKEARNLLEHIEKEHPNHPLTQPAWF